MNVFVIPSWYPSESNPIYGTFIQEQIRLVASHSKDVYQGVSLWGQGDEQHLLWADQPLQSIRKLWTSRRPGEEKIGANLTAYYNPALTWTRKLLRGNLNGIIAANARNLEQFIREYGAPDLIHAQASYPGACVAQVLAKKWHIPYVVTIRMSPFPFDEFLIDGDRLAPLIHEPLRNADALIATSSSLATRLGYFDFDPVRVVHNPVDIDFFTPSPTSVAGIQNLIAVGRMVHQKGFDLLLHAMKEFDQSLQLTLVGGGADENRLKQLATELGLPHIRFSGEMSRTATRDLIQQSDALVLSSRHETFGNVLVEAMACGKPVLATQCGGPSDIVTRDTGILVPSNDVKSLVNGLFLLQDGKWRADQIRASAVSRFSPTKFTERLTALYRQVIAAFQG